ERRFRTDCRAEKGLGEDINCDLCLVGKFFGERAINFAAMERTILSLRRPLQGASLKPTEDSSLYLIHFYHVIDLRKVILGGPCSFNNCILLIHQLSRGENPELVEFYHADFWVQYDASSWQNYLGNFMCIRVHLNICESLMRKKRCVGKEKTFLKTLFSYERLSLICYICGVVGHSCLRFWSEGIRVEIRRQALLRRNRGTPWGKDSASSKGVQNLNLDKKG
ncbi:hypothetical protein Gotri_003544, partial [Gossypium trilobum]|nr:hypothetical protein [Gossypium trilobum]